VHQWDAEITVDGNRARRLIGAAFPELELRSLSLLGEGWDNTVWLVDEQWVFRFPRREIAVPGVLRELDALPVLAPFLRTPVPVPVFRARPGEDFPWPFFGARYISGNELGRTPVDEGALAADLGDFLRTLHEIDEPIELPTDPNGRMDMTRRVPLAREQLDTIDRLGLWTASDVVQPLFEEALALAPATRSVIAHGDLHFRHVLADRDGALAGVIDWGDVCAASPAIDLLLYWSAFTKAGRSAFLSAYGPIADDDLLRARVLALGINAVLAEYGHRKSLQAVKAEALASLERVVRD
jgi:aminoglycoside phosphotransferase (APT) family kinase protein